MSSANQPDAITLRQQVAGLPAYVMAAWRTRYAIADGVDLQARAVINQEAAAVRAEGHPPDARTIWLRLVEQAEQRREAPPELVAAAALVGLAAGLRPQEFEPPATPAPSAQEVQAYDR